MRQRPLSPHLDIYRFAYTMATSIAHRITGVILTAGFGVLIYWLVAAASSAESYAAAQQIISSGPVKLLLVGWLLAFCYHLFNGIRHLNWDRGQAVAGRLVAGILLSPLQRHSSSELGSGARARASRGAS